MGKDDKYGKDQLSGDFDPEQTYSKDSVLYKYGLMEDAKTPFCEIVDYYLEERLDDEKSAQITFDKMEDIVRVMTNTFLSFVGTKDRVWVKFRKDDSLLEKIVSCGSAQSKILSKMHTRFPEVYVDLVDYIALLEKEPENQGHLLDALALAYHTIINSFDEITKINLAYDMKSADVDARRAAEIMRLNSIYAMPAVKKSARDILPRLS